MTEIIMLIFSSAGVMGSIAAILLSKIIHDNRKDAEARRKERIELQQLQSEGNERLAMLVLALVKFSKGQCPITELEEAENEYKDFNERNRSNARKLISMHTA